MSGDDSSTENDDSFFDLYSTENVLNTYHTVLERLKQGTSKNEAAVEEQDVAVKENRKDTVESDSSSDILSSQDSPDIIVLDDSPGSVSTAEELPGRRRSDRLRNRRKNMNLTNYCSEEVETRISIRNKRKKADTDIEIIELDKRKKCVDVNVSLDDEVNYEVSVKVIWKSVSVRTFSLRRFQKFKEIFQHFMKEENVPMERILLTLNNKKIWPNDTPESVDLKVFDFIEGGVLSCSVTNTSKPLVETKCSNEKDCIVVKVQDVDKKVVKFSINKSDPLKSLMIRYAEQIEFSLDKIRFYFDGEVLDSTETAISLGLDNDEVIDVELTE